MTSQPLTNPGVDAQGRSTYRLRVVNGALLNTTFQDSPSVGDLWRMQFTLKYLFN